MNPTVDHRDECPPCMRAAIALDGIADKAARQHRERAETSDQWDHKVADGRYAETVGTLRLVLALLHVDWDDDQVAEYAVDLLMAAHRRSAQAEAVTV